ncbi:NAD(P)/FAD-dependent oxidoreductase [Lacisediminimonas profundi]|uniref:NAD(P)/FAD-dependent oxidoreductase n=1 Tax=Lacisediminimonas profundi TaxID=2603856 RepID=UPI00124B9F83|nr:NAD(P)/FAD-dependent oxidoreductase [Lacisediminimonas profundi]
MDRVECVVVGAGVVGLAIARRLALAGREVLVLETNPGIGMETSSRNSEVIHAGLYYPTGSLKARLCVPGRDALYEYCDARGVGYRRCGKLIVATSEAQLPKLRAIQAQAHANDCHEVEMISADAARAMEPALSCVAALHSPNTGIIDSHGYMLALQGDAENAGALFAFDSRVTGGQCSDDGIVLQVRSGDGSEIEIETGLLVNAAGLWSVHLGQSIAGLSQHDMPTAYFAKGNYYSLSGRPPFSRLIYPVPEPGGLGVHLTIDLGGQARFGPDVEWLSDVSQGIDYRVDPKRADKFYHAIRSYWPGLADASLQPAYSGVRPKISPPDAEAADFLFTSHGNAHYMGLYGMESPGLTASLAIADHIFGMVPGG